MWSVLALLAILWNYGNCQDTDLPDTTIDLYQGTHPADIVFLLDTSTSNNVDLYNNIRSFLVHFVENSSVESGAVRFAFVPYTSYPDVKFYLNKYTRKADIITAIRDATFNYGERNTADAFDLLRRQVFTEGNGDRPQVPNIILMITTGTSDRNSYRTIQEAEALRFAGVGIFAIGIGLTNAREIEAMASRPTRENTFQLTSVDDLEAMRDIIFAQIFTRAEQSFRSPVTGSEQLDLIFLLHFSNNMRKESLNLVLEFVQNLLEYADIDSGQVRVGISIYRKTATNLYNLDRFSTKGELMEGIQQITTQYKAKAANTAAGLDFLRTDAFVGKAGDRPNVPNAVIIITDANSNVDQADAITAAEALKAAGTAIFSIGIGLENPDELDALATSRDFSLALTQASELNSNLMYIQDRIVALRTQADLPVTLPTITSPIFINAVLRARDLRTTIRPPALVEISSQNVAPPLSGSEKADIVFALHLSDKANDREVRTVLNYLNSLISGSDVDNGRVKIGLLTYNEDAEVIFNINQYNSVPLIRNEVFRTESRTRSSNVDASAALAVGTQMLDFRYSERSDAPKALIFVTDSASTENEELIPFERFRVESEQVNVFSIGIGLSGKEELESLATAPENVLTVSRYSELPSTIDDLKRKIFAFRTRDEKAVPDPEKPESTKPEPPIRTLAPPRQDEKGITIVPRNPPEEPFIEAGPAKVTLSLATAKPGTVVRSPQTCGLAKVDLVIILDASTSVSEPNYKKMLTFCKDFLKDADIDSGSVRVGIVIYSTDVQIQFHLNKHSTKSALFAAIDKIPYIYGSTNTADGINTMRTKMFTPANGDRPDVNNVAMIMTDGISNINARRTIPEAEQARAAGIHIYAVGIGLSDTKELNAMASPPASENSFSVKEFDELAGLAEKIFSSVCPGTTTTTTTTTTTRLPPPTTRTTTRARTTTLTTTTTPLTTPSTTTKLAPTAAPACGLAKVDLVIVLDASTSVTEPNYKKMLSFCKDFLKDADIDSGSVRVGIVIYSTDVQIQFHLNQYSTKAAVFQAIDKIPYIYGSTNTADGLKTMRTQMYTQANGDRPDVSNVALVMTDGISNINARRTIPEAELARTAGIHIYAIGIGLSDTKELDAIATPPARENSFAVQDFNELAGLAVRIFSSICPVVPTTPKPQEKTTAPVPVTTKRIPTTTTTLPTTKTTTMTTTTRTTTTTQSTTTIAPTTAKSLLACGLAKVDLVFILDASTSVTEANYKKMLTFCKDFLGNADIDSGNVRVGVVIYSTDVNIQFHLKQYSRKTDIFAAIDKIPYIYGSTNTADGLRTMRTEMFTAANGDRPDADNVAVIITDGISNINARRTIPEAVQARAMGIHIYAIGIGLSDSKELDAIASEPSKDNSFSVQEFDELVGLENKIFSAICLETVPPPTIPPATPAPTMMSTKIFILDIEEMKTACADAQVDLVYILDASTSVTAENFVKMLDFCKQLIEDAEIDNGNVQVGVVVYSSDVRVEFYLNVYNTRAKVIDAIGRIKYTYGSTNTAGGLKTMREQLFSFRNGDRPDVPNVAVILTDGVSNINAGRTVPEAQLARADGIHIYAIGIGLPDTRELDAIASPPASENSFSVRSFDELKGIKQKVFSSLCPGETRTTTRKPPPPPTTTTPKPTTTPKATTTTTKPTTPKPTPSTTKPTTTTTTTPKPTTPKPTPTTTKSTTKATTPRPTTTTARKTTTTPRRDGYDLVMVLDSSVNSSTFNWMMDVARDTIRELSIDDEEWRVGLVTYSTNPNREFNLNQYKKKADVLRQVDRISYRPGQTNTASALKYVRTNMFRESNGDRNFAKNYVILITGNEKSLDMYAAAEESYQMQRDGVATYVIGLGVNDKTELDELASLPLADYEVIIPAPNQIGEKPGEVIYNIRSRSPTPNPPPQRPRTTPGPVIPLEDLVCKSTGDIVFILDSSGSVGLENFYRVLNFTYNTVHQLDVESGKYRVGLVTFSDSARIEFYLNTYKKRGEIEPALQKVRYVYGSTHTAAALRRVRQEIFRAEAGDRPDVPNIVVMVTDGNSNVNHEMTLVEADMLKRAGVSMITVAVGFQRETRELVGLTSAPVEENLIYADDYRSLDKLSRKLLEPLCTDSDLCRTSPCRNDAICIDGIRSYTCLCPESYYGTNCEKQCSEPADVVFILDSSNTVGESSFQRMKDYVGSLIMEMNVEACNINVGLMKYSSAPMIQWGLGTYRDTDANIRAVNQVHYTRGVANMAAALKSLRTDIFNGRGGDRPKAKNIAYLLTDGSNNVHEEETQKNAELAISSGIRIIPVGVSLREREDVDLIAGAQDLNTIILDETIGEINEAALAPMVRAKDYCAGNPCKNGGKCLNESFGFTCECPAGFTGEDCTRSCSAGGDVVFAVDTSRYVTRKEMKRIRRFLRSVVKRLRFKEFKTGLVQYSNTANVVLTFADGDKKKNVLTAIAGLRNMVGDPDPAEALAKANFRIFKGDGAMADQPDYLVLLSKGLKNEEELLIQSNRLKMRGTRILGVGVSLTGSERELMESVVSYPSSNTAYYADDVEGLDDVADKVVEFMCNGQDKCAQNPCQNKGKCHAIGAEYYCDCPQGFAGKNCELKCDAKADVVFLLDSSGSVGHVDFRKVKDFAYRLIDDLNIGKDQTRVGLVAYSSRSRHGFYLKDYYEKYQLQNAISSIDFEYGKTNTADGLRHVREKLFNAAVGDRPDAQNFVVVVTDGLSNIKSEQTIIEADLLKSSGVHVYAIGIGKFDRYEIDRIASAPPSKNAFILEDYASLASISSDIIRATCKDPSVCDENPCRNDGRCEPTMNGPVCKCTGGYRGTYCEISCVSRKDIIFVLDSSSSVGEENFELALEFVSSVVEELSRGGSDNRYAMITFSNDVQLVFSLGRYSSAGTILNAIKYTRYRPGSTNTAGGLRTALEISSPEYGDRKDVDNIVILVADGQSNVNTEDTIPAADDLKKTGAKIITIGVGLSNYQELESIGSGAENVYKVTTYNVLGDVKADILENSCSEND
ncbi:hypothetical protein ACJMK2_013983 [Sinanodonta woodiana]|uniref:Collagen alpha-3(VI) chain n=1 Tax=Sinanodonta woodiana TaxID=1069815 RepID=A0ABD3V248_SINWO